MGLFNLVKTSHGSTLVQVMVAGALMAGASVYIMRSNQTQNKLQKNVVNKASQSAIAREFSETLLEGSVCLNTLKKAGTLSNNLVLAGLYNKSDKLIYSKDSELYGQIISDIKLIDYVASSGRKYQRSTVAVTTSSKKEDESVGGKSHVHKIPLFLITIDNKIDTCISDEAESALDALRRACNDLKGTFNESTAACENFYGEQGPVLNYVKENFCASGKGESCIHPYANQKCSGVDVRGANHNNWVLKGFNGGGKMQCLCVPRDCENPTLYCEGTDLGTDWCQKECPKGTKTVDECAPPPPESCEEWGDWTPDASSTCSNSTVAQTRSCLKGSSDSETRTISGSKTCSTNCTSWSDWSPLANTTCPDKDVQQTRNCTSGAGQETRVVKGEKKDCNTGECTILHPAGWTTPDCHCSEYYTPTASGAKSTMRNGETKVLYGSYCQIYTPGAGKQNGNGSVTVTCKNGSVSWTDAYCESGMIR